MIKASLLANKQLCLSDRFTTSKPQLLLIADKLADAFKVATDVEAIIPNKFYALYYL